MKLRNKKPFIVLLQICQTCLSKFRLISRLVIETGLCYVIPLAFYPPPSPQAKLLANILQIVSGFYISTFISTTPYQVVHILYSRLLYTAKAILNTGKKGSW